MSLHSIRVGRPQDPESVYYRRLLGILAVTMVSFLLLQFLTVVGCESVRQLAQWGALSENAVHSLMNWIFDGGRMTAMVVLVFAIGSCLRAMMTVVRQRPVADGLFDERVVLF